VVLGLVVSIAFAALASAAPASAAQRSTAASLTTVGSVKLADTKYSTGDVAIAKNGAFAIVAGDDEVQKVRLAPGPMEVLGATGNAGGRTVHLHSSDRFAYVLDGDGTALHVLNVQGSTPQLVRTLSFGRFAPELGFDLAVAPRGNALYVGYLGGVQVLSLAKPDKPRKVARVARPTAQYPGSIGITPNGKRLVATVSHGFREYLLRYDVSKPKKPKALGGKTALPFEPTDIEFSPSGKVTYVAGNSGTHRPGDFARLRTRDLKLLQRHADMPIQPDQLAISPDGQRLYSAMSLTLDSPTPSLGVLGTKPFEPQTFPAGIDWPHGLSVSKGGATKGHVYVIHQQFDPDSSRDYRTLSALTFG
jgi:DNA-binding beta-propeller fold protein YncE